MERNAVHIVSPVPDSSLPVIWEWMNEFSSLMVDDNCPHSFEEMVKKHRADLANGAKEYAVIFNDRCVGAVWAEYAGDSMYIGHLVFGRYELTPEEKLQVSQSLIREIFNAGARKIIWQMFADNRPFRIFLRQLGAVWEGTLRQGTRKNGDLKDIMLMASFPPKSATI